MALHVAAHHPAVLTGLLLCGLAVLLVLTLTARDLQQPPGFMYGIVLDAGSSHTALYIYKWPADKENGTGVVTQHSECEVKGGGISSYAGQAGAAGRSLEVCLDQAVKAVPSERHPLTPVYLGATAGMRLLQLSSPESSSQILQEVGQKIQSYPFNYRGATILSGQEEGAYGWVTVNYLLENFIKYGFVGHWLRPGKATVGALDFGGASTQITFATPEKVEDKQDLMKLRLYGHDYSLYTHSFLCYGRDQALKKVLAHIVKSQNYSGLVTHPCYPADHNRTLTMSSLFDSPCTEQYQPQLSEPQASVTVRGSGRYQQCLGNMSAIFSNHSCHFSHCSFNDVFQPNITGSFMAFSAFFYIHSFLERVSGITVNTPAQLEQATVALCTMTYSQLLAVAPDEESRLPDYCASAALVKTLMLGEYGFNDETFPHVFFQMKAGGASVGWALGYMLTLSNLLPAERGELRKTLIPEVWGTLIALLLFLLVASLLFIFLHFRVGKKAGSARVI